MNIFSSLFIAFALVSGLSSATAQETNPTPPDRKPIAPERLVMPLFPAGWSEVYHDNGMVEVVEYLPEGQSAENWQDKIVLQVYNELNDLPLDAIQRRMQSGLNNGCASAFWTLGCRYINNSAGTGIGETQYTKAIQGDTSLYVLSRIWRTPAFGGDGPALSSATINDGVAFLTTAITCVPDSENHPCTPKD